MSDTWISYHRFDDSKLTNMRVSAKDSRMDITQRIRDKLNSSKLKQFEDSCFGHFLNVDRICFIAQIVNHML